jgi:hypothetical protein
MMSDQVSGQAAVDLAFIAYDNGRKSVLGTPQRLRMQALPGVAVDVTVEGEVTPAALRNTSRMLLVMAEILDESPPADAGREADAPRQVAGD